MTRLVTIFAVAAFMASAPFAFAGRDAAREALLSTHKEQVAAQKKIAKQDAEKAKELAEKMKPENKKAER